MIKLNEEEKDTLFFDNIGFPEKCSSSCEYYTAIKDAYSTGDSPTVYDCDAVTRKDCPMYIGENDA